MAYLSTIKDASTNVAISVASSFKNSPGGREQIVNTICFAKLFHQIYSKQNLYTSLPISVMGSYQQTNNCKLTIKDYSHVEYYFIKAALPVFR